MEEKKVKPPSKQVLCKKRGEFASKGPYKQQSGFKPEAQDSLDKKSVHIDLKAPEKTQRALEAHALMSKGQGKGEAMKKAGLLSGRSAQHYIREAQVKLYEAMERHGVTADWIIKNIKEGVELSKTTGRAFRKKDGSEGRMPDLKAMNAFMLTLGNWTSYARAGQMGATNNTINLFGGGLDEGQRQRVSGLVALLEEEVKRRGFADIPEGGAQAQDAEALPGVVEPVADPEAPAH